MAQQSEHLKLLYGGNDLPPHTVPDGPSAPTRKIMANITPATFLHKAPEANYTSGFAAGFYATMLSAIGTGCGFVGTFLPCCGCSPYRTIDQGHAAGKTSKQQTHD